jgi:hypothetical protein
VRRWLYVWLILVIVLFVATGCATCREHPVLCSVGGAIVVGSVAASFEHNRQPQQAYHRMPIDLK